MRENLYLNRVVRECQVTNKVNKERDNTNINLKKKILNQIDVYCGILEGKRHQSLEKPDKVFKWSKANWIEQNKIMTCHFPHHSQTALLYFFEKLFHNNSVKQNRLES